MKLYVVNEDSPNPADWSIWSEWALVVAESPREALRLVPANNGQCAEIPLDKPLLLAQMFEPNWGEDL